MKIQVAILLLLLAGLGSCQREIDFSLDSNNGADSTQTGMISRYQSTYRPDNFDWHIMDFRYDSEKRLLTRKMVFRIKRPDGSITTEAGSFQYFRDATGRVTRIGSDPDTASLQFYVNYENAGSEKVQSLISVRKQGATSKVIDSIVYFYTSDNRVSRMDFYMRNPATPDLLEIGGYELYTHDLAGNLLTRKVYNGDNATGYVLGITYTYGYDNKPNPLYHGTLRIPFLPYEWLFHSPNNMKEQWNDYTSPFVPDDGLTYTIEYNTLLKPVSYTKSGDTVNFTKYFYFP